jgi:hypothetical protein
MRQVPNRRLFVAGAVAAVAALVSAAVANGGQAVHETIHVEDETVFEDFCDVADLDVRAELTLDLRTTIVPHGPDGLEYFLQHGTRTETLTNPATGSSVTSVVTAMEKDKVVTDNGNGTLTVLVLATGDAVLYGEEGKAIARDAGQLRVILFVAADGSVTRGDVVKGSTGRSDDFCDAAVPALT